MRYPQMSLELRHDSSRNLIHGVINGELNLAFLGLVPAKEALLESYILFTQPFFPSGPRQPSPFESKTSAIKRVEG